MSLLDILELGYLDWNHIKCSQFELFEIEGIRCIARCTFFEKIYCMVELMQVKYGHELIWFSRVVIMSISIALHAIKLL